MAQDIRPSGVLQPLPVLAALGAQRGGLRLYQWLWLLFCVGVALAVAVPRLVSQPIIYQTSATVQFDAARYAGLYLPDGSISPDYAVALRDAEEAVRQRLLAQRNLRFGAPDFRISYVPDAPGSVQVIGIGATPTEAQQLATAAADELVRQIRAAGGREVLRNLMGWELVAALQGEDPDTPFQAALRGMIERNAHPMSRPIEPVALRIDAASLPEEERNDLARALEARYDLWTFAINAHNTGLDMACDTASISTTATREAALLTCAANDPAVAAELDARNRAIASRLTVDALLQYLRQNYNTNFTPEAVSAAYRTAVPLPTTPEPHNTAALLLLAVVAGLGFGAIGVYVDRSAGVMDKLRDLWAYRELIRNMVLRDLRTRYKSSALGYLWTQLAPLLLMLLFLFVFSVLLPAGIALYPVFLIVGLMPWNYFAESVMGGTRSVIDNAALIKKVYFPREVLPLASVFSALVNFLLSLPMMFVVMAITQWLVLREFQFTWTIAYMPILIGIQTIYTVGIALFLSALAVQFRDIVHLVGIGLQFWFFLTPIFYGLDLIGDPLARIVRWVNPMASLVEFYREILYGNTVPVGQIPTPSVPAPDAVLRVVVTAVLVLTVGYWFFQRHSKRFGEEL